MNPIKKKSEPSVASAFRSIFYDPKYSTSRRRPIRVHTDKGKEFINKCFKYILKGKGGVTSFRCAGTPT